ncbi:hypothetical protein HYY69_01650 [Candidatus Woesearchaeota archaeon]|nr:hypothetical protein [Candidatus Woesearchaeota archaeon]
MRIKNLLKGILAFFAGYAGIEVAVVSTDVVHKGESEAHQEDLAERHKIAYAKQHDFYYGLFEPHPRLGFVLSSHNYGRHNQEHYTLQGSPHGTFLILADQLGFRDEGDDRKTAPVAVVGGTSSFGSLYPAESFSEQLEVRLGTTVSNFSMLGYKPWQFNTVMREFPDYFKNRTIVYCISPEDFVPEPIFDPAHYYAAMGWDKYKDPTPPEKTFDDELPDIPFKDRFLTTYLWNLAFTSEAEIAASKEVMRRYGTVPDPEAKTLDNLLTHAVLNPQSMSHSLAMLGEAIDIADKLNSDMVFVLSPSKGMVLCDKYQQLVPEGQEKLQIEFQLYATVERYLRSRSVSLINLTPSLQNAYRLGLDLYHGYDRTGEWQGQVAEVLAEHLRGQQFLVK